MNRKEDHLIACVHDETLRPVILAHLSLQYPRYTFSAKYAQLLVRGVGTEDAFMFFYNYAAGYIAGYSAAQK